jgi:hypothetical protein
MVGVGHGKPFRPREDTLMVTTLLWTDAQTHELRAKILHAVANGETVQCPEDGATLDLNPDYSITNLSKAVWATCPKCHKTDRFA